MRRVRILAACAVVPLLLTACGDDDDEGASTTTTAAGGQMDDDGDEMMDFSFGEPGDPADADRTIEVALLDTMAFDPAEIEVTVGETITFEITNEGKIEHDFTIGDEATQDEHEEEMSEGEADHEEEDPNAVEVEPGATAELTWTFTEAGDLLIGCHVPGHYDAGMVADLTVTE